MCVVGDSTQRHCKHLMTIFSYTSQFGHVCALSLWLVSEHLQGFFLPSFLAFFVLSTFFKIIIQFSLVSHWALGVFYFHLRKMKAREGVTERLRYCSSLELVSQSSISVVQVTEQPSPASAHS